MLKLDEESAKNVVKSLNFKKRGEKYLVVVVTVDEKTKEILMVAFADEDAVFRTLTTSLAHYYSTSRNKLWLKGESSSNFQIVDDIYVDCDMDSIIYYVRQMRECKEGLPFCKLCMRFSEKCKDIHPEHVVNLCDNGNACHTGRRSCFFRHIREDGHIVELPEERRDS